MKTNLSQIFFHRMYFFLFPDQFDSLVIMLTVARSTFIWHKVVKLNFAS